MLYCSTEVQTWDEYEVTRFLETARDSHYYALFHTALLTGMRWSELLGLQWQDIAFHQSYVNRSLHHLSDGSYVLTQPKSAKNRRTIALSPSSIFILAEHKEKQAAIRAIIGIPLKEVDFVFSTAEGKPLRLNTVSRAWTVLAARAGVKVIRLHDAPIHSPPLCLSRECTLR